ncbi:MAG TPA: 1,2-phenylacetyl-CoA epoxidase subunit PaaC [Puia sp.]|nr:1,2-phenylacetyl-CoA epoxidase subunit PaaC [Puia sp.]
MTFPSHIGYSLFLADNALILGHRNSEWTGHGPILEQDIALSNIALDLIGQARWLYQHAARLCNESGHGTLVTEDSLAYGRDSWDFRNCLLVEQANGDWGKTVLRQFLFSTWQYYYFKALRQSRDGDLAAIAEKSVKEVTYHLRWSSEWVIRLGDGTDESHQRMLRALDQLWKFTGELFVAAPYELALMAPGIAVDPASIEEPWTQKVAEVFAEAGLALPQGPGETWMQTGGKLGVHTEQLGYLLAEMQFLQRAYPNCEW